MISFQWGCPTFSESGSKDLYLRQKIIIFLQIVFFVESHLKTIKWSKLSQIGPKLHKTSNIKNNIAKKI